MNHDLSLGKLAMQIFVSGAEMVNPDRGIGEDQFGRILCGRAALARALRRGMFFNSGIVPPRDANLRALSRSISAFSASRSNAVFSATPVNSWAVRTRSSSSATVVRMG